MAVVYGNIGEFSLDDGVEKWQLYTERLQFYFEANGITDDSQKRAILLASVGCKTYQLIKDVLAPSKPSDKGLKEIVAAIQERLNPKPSPIVARYEFFNRTRQPEEAVAGYITTLNRMAETCEFGNVRDMM